MMLPHLAYVTFICYAVIIHPVYSNISCQTSSFETGTCTRLSECRHLKEIFINRHSNPGAIDTLHQNLCRNHEPLVCCAEEHFQTQNRGSFHQPGHVSPPVNRPINNHNNHNNNNNNNHNNNNNFNNNNNNLNNNNNNNIHSLPQDCGTINVRRIIGGTESELGQWPWLALLGYYRKGQFLPGCAGALITKRHVLTAEHCFFGSKFDTVRLGEHDIRYRDNDKPHQEFKIARRFSGPFNTATYANDIAVLYLDREVFFNDYVRPICLPLDFSKRNEMYFGEMMDIAGWGQTLNTQYSYVLNHAEVETVPLQACQQRYNSDNLVITDKHVCAGTGYWDTCKGDSGGPLMKLDNKDNKYYLIGIVSFGPKVCGSSVLPGVYTKVGAWVDWIQDQLSFN